MCLHGKKTNIIFIYASSKYIWASIYHVNHLMGSICIWTHQCLYVNNLEHAFTFIIKLWKCWRFLKTDMLLTFTHQCWASNTRDGLRRPGHGLVLILLALRFLIQGFRCCSLISSALSSIPDKVFCSRIEASDAWDWFSAGGRRGMCCFWIQPSNASCRPGWCSSRLRRWAAVTLSKGLVLVLRSRATCSKDCNLSGSYTDEEKHSYSFEHYLILVSDSYFHTDLKSHCCRGQFL